MSIFRLYGRVLGLLGSESRLAWTLALANMALASAQFAEPVLLGRIIDTLTGAQARGEPPSWSRLGVLLAAWAGFGLFTIVCGTLIALYADRLAHRRRHVVLTGYFEHVLQLPLSYHGNTHSGRLMKVSQKCRKTGLPHRSRTVAPPGRNSSPPRRASHLQ